MLRKDVQIGLSIGGVLLAVLIVYGIVASHNKHHTNAVVLDKSSKPVEPAGGTGGTDIPPPLRPTDDNTSATATPTHKTTPSNEGVPPSGQVAGTPTPSDSETPSASNDEKKGTNWAILLADDKAGEIARTQTPPLAATDTHLTGDASSTDHGAVTPPGNTATPPAVGSSNLGGATFTPAPPAGEATPPATQPTSGTRTHTVQKGETFSSISKAFYGNARFYAKIAAANPTVNPNRLRPGTVINLPDIAQAKSADPTSSARDAAKPASNDVASAAGGTVDARTQYRIASGDSLYKISIRLYGSPEEVDHLYDLNKAEIGADRAKLKLGMVLKLPAAPTATASR